jgi:hypothetical protein
MPIADGDASELDLRDLVRDRFPSVVTKLAFGFLDDPSVEYSDGSLNREQGGLTDRLVVTGSSSFKLDLDLHYSADMLEVEWGDEIRPRSAGELPLDDLDLGNWPDDLSGLISLPPVSRPFGSDLETGAGVGAVWSDDRGVYVSFQWLR